MATPAAQMTPEAVLALMGLPAEQAMSAAQTATMISHVIVHVTGEFQTTAATVANATSATATLREQVDKALIHNGEVAKKAADDLREQLEQQDYKLGEVESQTDEAIQKIKSNIQRVEQVEFDFRKLYATCEASFNQSTQSATERILDIQRQIQNLVDRTLQSSAEGGSGGFGGGQQRDRQIFDPRDYKIEQLGSSPSVAAFKKWRADVEIYLDTIGPTWKGVKTVLQQVRHSSTSLIPTRESMQPSVNLAKELNKGVPTVDDVTMDWSEKGELFI